MQCGRSNFSGSGRLSGWSAQANGPSAGGQSGCRRAVRVQAGGQDAGGRSAGSQSGCRRAVRVQAGDRSAGGRSECRQSGCRRAISVQAVRAPSESQGMIRRVCRRRAPVRECPLRQRVSGKIRPSTRSGAGRLGRSTACARYADPGRHTAPGSMPRRPAAHTP